MKSEIRAYINIAVLAAVLLVNYLSIALPFNELTQAEINFQLYPVLFTPAPYVFSIWGLIYLLLIGFIIYQALPQYRDNRFNNAVGILFAVTGLLNIFWLLSWHYLQIGLSFLIMVLLLLTLLVIYFRIKSQDYRGNALDWLLVKLPFNLYLAWICVAALANLNVLLYDIGWLGTGFGSALLTMLMIVAAAAVALFIFAARGDYIFPLVFAWSFVGIAVRHGREAFLLAAVAFASAAALLFLMGWIAQRRNVQVFKGKI